MSARIEQERHAELGFRLFRSGAGRRLYGFYDLAGTAAIIAKFLLVVFLVLLVVSAFSGALRGRPPEEMP